MLIGADLLRRTTHGRFRPHDLLHDYALAWFATGRANLVAAVPHALRHGFAGHAWRIAANIDQALGRTGVYWDLAAAAHPTTP